MRILNFGSLNYDTVYTVDHILAKGETEHAEKMELFCGGKGLNQSIALAKAGAEVYHAGQVGEDGEMLITACQEAGVDIRYIKKGQGKSGHTVIQVEKGGQNCILLFGGSNQQVSHAYMDEVLSHFGAEDMFLMQNEINDSTVLLDKAYAQGLKIVLNPSPFDENMKKCDLHKVSLFLLNEIEGWQISGEKASEDILEWFAKELPEAQVVLTLGSDGAIYQYKGKKVHQEIFPVKAVDTTAAGDTFTGYFLACLLQNKEVAEALRVAAKAASLAVSKKGAVASIPSKEEVNASFE